MASPNLTQACKDISIFSREYPQVLGLVLGKDPQVVILVVPMASHLSPILTNICPKVSTLAPESDNTDIFLVNNLPLLNMLLPREQIALNCWNRLTLRI